MDEKKEDSALLKHLDALVESLHDLAGKAIKDRDVDAVHDARVATRRLKAAMDLLKPLVSGRHRSQFNKILRALRKRLGPLRDADVALDHLAGIKAQSLQPAAQWMIAQLENRRRKAAADAAEDLPPPRVLAKLGTWWGVRAEIAAGDQAVGSLLAESVHIQLDAFAEAAAGLIDQAAERDPHQLRIAGKSLRYTLEMAKPCGFILPPGVLAEFKRIQTALGNWHDDVVLTQLALCDSLEQDVAYHDLELQQGLLALAADSLRRAQRQLAKVTDFWRSDGLALAERIRGAFPLTKPAVTEAEVPPPAEVASPDTALPSPPKSA